MWELNAPGYELLVRRAFHLPSMFFLSSCYQSLVAVLILHYPLFGCLNIIDQRSINENFFMICTIRCKLQRVVFLVLFMFASLRNSVVADQLKTGQKSY